MADTRNRMILAALLALPLGGCNSFLGMHLFGHGASKPMSAAATVPPSASSATATLAGRSELDAGRPGTAIEKFQQALANGEPVAPALNGMAVAYARIGRLDLAQRFFQQAIAVDPADARYQVNLAALMQTPAFAMVNDDIVGDAPGRAVAPVLAHAERAGQPAAVPRAGGLQRVSRFEVRIMPASTFPAPFTAKQAGGEPRLAAANPSPVSRSLPLKQPSGPNATGRRNGHQAVEQLAQLGARPAAGKLASPSSAAGGNRRER